MQGQKPENTHLPTADGGKQKYKAAGKLEGKRVLLTGGDSGIGRATSVLFAMEGASTYIAYLPQEEKDAQQTKKEVEEQGQKCWLYPTDLREQKNCKDLVDKAVQTMGGIDVLVLNHAVQNVR